jgi:hypothetical protein
VGPNGQPYLVTNNQAYGGSVSLSIFPIYFANNKNSPIFTSSDNWFCKENVSIESVVYTARATDADVGAVLTYSISGGVDSSKFNIDPSTGGLTFKTLEEANLYAYKSLKFVHIHFLYLYPKLCSLIHSWMYYYSTLISSL